jgi:hypothetical protein
MGGVVSSGAALVPGPGHKAGDRSLSIRPSTTAPDGFVVHSFAGDDPLVCKDYVRGKMGLPPWKPNGSGNGSNPNHSRPVSRPERLTDIPEWTPPDRDGKPKFVEWGNDGPPKHEGELRRHVYRRRDDGLPVRIKIKNGTGTPFTNWYRVRNASGVVGWQAKKPDGYRVVPYIGAVDPFDDELANDWICWPEGEKDCDTLSKINIPAFTFGGCGDGLPEDASTFLKGRRVAILSDNDKPGREHADKKVALARNAGAEAIKRVRFPGVPEHGDVSDFIASGRNADELIKRIDEAPMCQVSESRASASDHAESNPGRLLSRCAADIVPKPIDFLWPGRIARGKHTAIAGEPGDGKSQLSVYIAATVSQGGQWHAVRVARLLATSSSSMLRTAQMTRSCPGSLWPALI